MYDAYLQPHISQMGSSSETCSCENSPHFPNFFLLYCYCYNFGFVFFLFSFFQPGSLASCSDREVTLIVNQQQISPCHLLNRGNMIETAGVQYVVLVMFVLLFCIFMFIGNFKMTLVLFNLFLSVISIGYCFLADIYA